MIIKEDTDTATTASPQLGGKGFDPFKIQEQEAKKPAYFLDENKQQILHERNKTEINYEAEGDDDRRKR